MRFLSVNTDCFLIELSSLEETLALYSKLQNAQLKGIKDLIPAAKTILVFLMKLKLNFKHLYPSSVLLKSDQVLSVMRRKLLFRFTTMVKIWLKWQNCRAYLLLM